MEFFEVINKRRSVRNYTSKPVPKEVICKALEAATLAPNSSNTQTWDFYWVKTADKKKALIKACLSQRAARTAQELIVIVADPTLWKRSNEALLQYTDEIKAPPSMKIYYKKLIPFLYSAGILNVLAPLKWMIANIGGLFRPMPRGPNTSKDIQTVCIKSAALAAENFALAISAQGFATCMMEGFDECRVLKILKTSWSARIVMVISVGEEAPDGTMGPRFRLPTNLVVHEI